MSKHTPGPWIKRSCGSKAGKNYSILARKKYGWCNLLKGNKFHETETRVTIEEAQANARLIASAPDLLEALSGALDSLEYVEQVMPGKVGYGVRQERIAKARAAIAKATGND